MKNFVRFSLSVLALSGFSAVVNPLPAQAQNISTVVGGGPPAAGTAVLAANASVGTAAAVHQDSHGNTYIVDNDFGRIYKVDTTGHLTVFAGNGVTGFSGDNGPAVNAELFEPSGMCLDSSDNVFIADSDNGVIREVPAVTAGGKTAGDIYTVAGIQSVTNFSYGGDGGPALSANLQFPDGCAVDSKGNLFIADRGNNAIRVVIGASNMPPVGLAGPTVAGDIYLYTGSHPATPTTSPAPGYSANGTPTVGAALAGPTDVFVDTHDNVFIGDFGTNSASNEVIREVPATAQTFPFAMVAGDIYTVAGVPGQMLTTAPTSGVVATTEKLNGPEGIFVDAAGNLFFADNGTAVVREVAGPTSSAGMVAGDIYVVAGNGTPGYSGDGGDAVSANIKLPRGTVVDATGKLYIADSQNDRVRVVTGNSGSYLTETISTFAGNSSESFSNTNFVPPAPAIDGQIDVTAGLAFDLHGNLAIADVGTPADDQSLIRGVAAPIATSPLTTLVGQTSFNDFSNSAPFVENNALGVAYDSAGNLYVADTGNCIVRKFTGTAITTVAGVEPTPNPVNSNFTVPHCGFNVAGGAGLGTTLGAVNGVAIDASNNVFFSDPTNNVIWEVPSASVGAMVAGNAYIVVGMQSTTGAFAGQGVPANQAKLNTPTGIYFDVYGNLFIADTGNNLIREVPAVSVTTPVAMTAGSIYTVAGAQGQPAGFSGDNGAATSAQLNGPFTMVVDNAENIFIADTNNQVIREVAGTTAGGKTAGDVYTIAGTHGSAGFSGDGAAATGAHLNFPKGLAIDSHDAVAGSASLLIADSINNRVRSIAGVANVTAVATADFSPASVTFLPQPLNIASAPMAVTLTNNGSATLTGVAITITGTGAATYSLAPAGTCTSTLAAGQSCAINVTFTPTATAASNASLSIADNAFGNPQTVALTGTGINGSPAAIVTPAALTTFTSVVGVASAAQVVTVSNTAGTAPLTISTIAIAGANAGDFSQTNTCGALPATVAINANCTISVTFKPTAVGSRAGTLSITDNAASSPQVLALTGTATPATAPAITFAPTSLTFASQAVATASAPQPVMVTNSGNAALNITSIAIAGPNASDFTFGSATTCSLTGGTLIPTTACTLSVVYKPAAAGTSTAMIMLADNVTGGTQTVALSGISTAALALTLGPAAGASATQTVAAGATASYSLQVGANQNTSVTITCSGAPTAAACVVPTAAVAVTAGTPAAVAVTVTTTARGLLVPQSQPATRMQPPAGIPMLAISVLAMLLLIATVLASTQNQAGRLRFARVALSACLVLMPIAAAALIGGCGGGSSSTPPPVTGTPAGSYTIVVKATSGSQTATTNLTLVVQ